MKSLVGSLLNIAIGLFIASGTFWTTIAKVSEIKTKITYISSEKNRAIAAYDSLIENDSIKDLLQRKDSLKQLRKIQELYDYWELNPKYKIMTVQTACSMESTRIVLSKLYMDSNLVKVSFKSSNSNVVLLDSSMVIDQVKIKVK
jgi:hypothetical protein